MSLFGCHPVPEQVDNPPPAGGGVFESPGQEHKISQRTFKSHGNAYLTWGIKFRQVHKSQWK